MVINSNSLTISQSNSKNKRDALTEEKDHIVTVVDNSLSSSVESESYAKEPVTKNGITASDPHHSSSSKDNEMIRLIMQYLHDHGYKSVCKKLEAESKVIMETKPVKDLRANILESNWQQAEQLLGQLDLGKFELKKVGYSIRQEKYIQALLNGNYKTAIHILQNEIVSSKDQSLHIIEKLSSLLLYQPYELLDKLSACNLQYGRQMLLEKIQSYIPPHIMLPSRRLEELIGDTESVSNISLLKDHTCYKNQLKFICHVTCKGHTDEVWYIQFSPDNKYLATASRDKTVIVWNTSNWEQGLVLNEHKDAITYLSWSFDSKYLATCSNDSRVIIWDIQNGKLFNIFQGHTDIVPVCSFFPNTNEMIVSGGLDLNLIIWKTRTGEMIHKWSGHRVTDLMIHPSGMYLYAVCQEKKIRKFDLVTHQENSCLSMFDSITSLVMSKGGSFCLVSLANKELQVWDIEKRKILQKFTGHRQNKFVIRSCLATGMDENFVISGSEDCLVYIWHRRSGVLLAALEGHTAVVNSVASSPTASMFASASDDGTIRVWEALKED